MAVTIHCEPRIAWQGPFAAKMAEGLKNLGLRVETTNHQQRCSDIAILLGTSLWRGIEATGRYLLVDRCSFGDTNQYVSLVWDGHGRRGDHCVPEVFDGARWNVHGVPLVSTRYGGAKRVICGQTEPYCPQWDSIDGWYLRHFSATHFRTHPAGSNPTGLPEWRSFDDCEVLITLNSSVAVDGLINGVAVVTDDIGSMAWPGHNVGEDRLPLLYWLAWTQWHHEEIRQGEPIRHLFDSI